MFEGEGRGEAVYYENSGRVGGVARILVFGEGGDELALRAIAVEADIEGFGELEVPLGEGARMEGVEEADGGRMRVLVLLDLVVVLLVCEEGDGR